MHKIKKSTLLTIFLSLQFSIVNLFSMEEEPKPIEEELKTEIAYFDNYILDILQAYQKITEENNQKNYENLYELLIQNYTKIQSLNLSSNSESIKKENRIASYIKNFKLNEFKNKSEYYFDWNPNTKELNFTEEEKIEKKSLEELGIDPHFILDSGIYIRKTILQNNFLIMSLFTTLS